VRQRICPFVLYRVLGSDHAESLRQPARLAVYRHGAFLHSLQESTLGLWACAVDLVSQDYVCKDRPRPELEVTSTLVVDVQAGDVGG
jgi:hypothetical protein